MRIAVHPSLQRMGYGSEALRQLMKHLEGGADLSLLTEKPGVTEDAEKDAKSDIETGDEGDGTADEESVDNENSELNQKKDEKIDMSKLKSEIIGVRDAPPLLVPCSDALPTCSVDYIGTSFGLTLDLLKFHHRLGFRSVYLRQSPNDITGPNSICLICPMYPNFEFYLFDLSQLSLCPNRRTFCHHVETLEI